MTASEDDLTHILHEYRAIAGMTNDEIPKYLKNDQVRMPNEPKSALECCMTDCTLGGEFDDVLFVIGYFGFARTWVFRISDFRKLHHR